FRQLIVVHLADQNAVEFILSGRGRVEAADQVHQGGFAGAGRAHDGDVFAALDFERHVPQGVNGFRAHLVTPRNFLKADQRHNQLLGSSPVAAPLRIFLPSSRSWLMARNPPETISSPSFKPSTISQCVSSLMPVLTGAIFT